MDARQVLAGAAVGAIAPLAILVATKTNTPAPEPPYALDAAVRTVPGRWRVYPATILRGATKRPIANLGDPALTVRLYLADDASPPDIRGKLCVEINSDAQGTVTTLFEKDLVPDAAAALRARYDADQADGG